MFQSELEEGEQKVFLNLAYTLMAADNELHEDKLKDFSLYQLEVKADR